MNWIPLNEEGQLQTIVEESRESPVLIFKHSTRCSISAVSLNRLERNWKESDTNGLKTYFLDLISYRDISNRISVEFNIEHQSPQVLVIQNGECVHEASHFGIDYEDIRHASLN